MESFDFVRMKPDDTVIREVSDGLVASVLAKPGKAYAVYLYTPLPATPEPSKDYAREGIKGTIVLDLPAGHYRTEWIDTLSGEIITSDELTHSGGPKQLDSPKFSSDIALRIVATPGSNGNSK